MPNFTEEEDYLIASFVLKHGNKLSYKGTRLFKEMEGSKVRARGCWTKAHTDAAEGGPSDRGARFSWSKSSGVAGPAAAAADAAGAGREASEMA